ncbi:MAG: bifunctional pyr operon transcriptional regulator/uracil phosphoribosyltransferase PyrR [Thermoleophilia bacterium]|nr:bifunctional pyr operon transcriptional regulator/uracil phosphoribosyltransferase PyrR [Thermoleophilia bacterium]
MGDSSNDQGRKSKVLLDDEQIGRTLARMTHEIAEQAPDLSGVVLVGIQSGGVELAARLAALFGTFYEVTPPTGAIDITFYRDDLDIRLGKEYGQPKVRETDLPFDINGKTVVLVDDVLYTGRTIRAAIDALFDYGRPLAVRLAVLVDRGHRDLPIRPDFVGKNVPTSRSERVEVHLAEVGGADQVVIEE